MDEVASTAKFYEWLAWAEKHRRQLATGAGVVVFVGLVVGFFVWRSGQKEIDAGEALSRVFVPQATSPANRSEDPAGYLKVASEHANSQAAGRALLMAAGGLFAQAKYAEAQAQFEKFVREHRSSGFVAEAQLGVAASLEAQGKTNEAVTAYRNLVDRHPGQAVIPQAKFALARIYEARNEPAMARPLYEEIARVDPYGSIGSEAGMRLEELKAKYPNLATNATPVSPSLGTSTNQ